jgi:CxxC-x17-CxxC domain-containing protein
MTTRHLWNPERRYCLTFDSTARFDIGDGAPFAGKEVGRHMVGEDKIIACRDCGSEFVFTAGEQAFFSERGFMDPVRCPACRSQRRRERNTDGDSSMGAGGGGPRQMFDVTCANCGQATQVPFEPRQGRPVYCRDCFQAQRSVSM